MTWTRQTLLGAAGALAGLLLILSVAAPAQAALTLTSTPDPSWRVDGRVYAEAIVGDTLIVGGSFTTATSPSGATAPRANLAAFSLSTGALLTGWRADTDAVVRALVATPTSVWAGGSFTTIGGAAHARLARLDPTTGRVHTTFTASANAEVRALAVDGSALYVGGFFTTVDGVARTSLARVAPMTGALATGFVGSADGGVYALAKSPTTSVLYAAGNFATLSGVARAGAGAVSSTTGAATGLVLAGAVQPTLSLAVDPTGARLYGGTGGASNSAYAWSPSTGAAAWRVTTGGDIQAITSFDQVVYLGFHDSYQTDTSTKLLAADAATGVVDPTFRPTFDRFFGVFSLAASSAGLAAGGDFTQVTGVPAQGFVRFRAH